MTRPDAERAFLETASNARWAEFCVRQTREAIEFMETAMPDDCGPNVCAVLQAGPRESLRARELCLEYALAKDRGATSAELDPLRERAIEAFIVADDAMALKASDILAGVAAAMAH
jgi:hypothetical protein